MLHRQAPPGQPALELTAELRPPSIVAYDVEFPFLIQSVEVEKLTFPKIRRKPGKNSRAHQAEFFGTGNQNTCVRIAALCRSGESCDDTAGVVSSTGRGTS